MKKLIAALIFIGAAFGAAFYLGRIHLQKGASLEAGSKESSSFKPTLYPAFNRSFTIVVIGCNNGAFVEKTLRSLFSQLYESFRVIYIDDASDDGSFELARDLIYQYGDLSRVTLVRNEARLGHLANMARAVQACPSDEIIVSVNGTDWLAHKWVLQRLNQYYANSDLWMTYGQYREYPHFSLGSARPVEEPIRAHPFTASHLKTFYAGLFKKIQAHDFLFQGAYFTAAGELAYMIPMLEMAKYHSACIEDILYIANRSAPPVDDRETALRAEKAIRSQTSYTPLVRLQFSSEGT